MRLLNELALDVANLREEDCVLVREISVRLLAREVRRAVPLQGRPTAEMAPLVRVLPGDLLREFDLLPVPGAGVFRVRRGLGELQLLP